MTIGAVLFDCDGVLVDSEVVGLEDSAEFLRQRGFDWGPSELIRRFTGKRDDRFRAELIEAYGDVLGRPATEAEADELFEGMLEARRLNKHKMQIVEGAIETMAVTQRLGLPMAVASSSRQEHLDSKIDRFRFAAFVRPHVYSADRVAHGKPAPDIFLHSAEQLGIAPQNCLVLEDSPYGVMAGVAAGMEVWGFLGGGHCFDGHSERLSAAGAVKVFDDHFAVQQELIAVMEEHI
ncbi:HAD family phosphatase [Parvularcula sp. ZS-1/3]|uniref:HAD family phosphatase n=1 Tax=Parvularcula mediterranea TaxID=2732508 RepID=A0A7Y3W4Z8_9PROT|nr:HAD family phosphatase [Parvularcula mediterranea]NNU16089.1 HAD family phosphatase [Parvularcula mediterranea]